MKALLLAIDVGNTETVLGLFRGRQLVRHWRIATDVRRTPDELAHLLRQLLTEEGVEGSVRGIVASVVPAVDPIVGRGVRRALGQEPRLITDPSQLVRPAGPLPVSLDVEEPHTVGADRMLNTLAAAEIYAADVIAVDLGTATTYDCITADGVFLGGVIAPGPRAGIEGLAQRASRLPYIDLVPPDRVVGRRTDACLRSGCFYSIVDAIDGMVRRIKREWGRPEALAVATGGLAAFIAPHCETVDIIEPYLTLYGLEIANRLIGDPVER
ncbi:MAG: type III pantothenate kinase [Gemmatimonadetes bacterium]|uniref:Type III pantothenate kinase n=1 Tax=Candidatus Kutchimonas denitrificans TaxID=3056748 RepID=A0AAE4ZCK0_9BACT|nr:type III pantothenate kinase [Gemmatimonadota bacterium]NIR76031.1 type III pantothenate kinase [Candidatus Kutchimonas denitrificans]NIS02223.1 type III pantothenate kinase [Gemmatimonadota bacterium]NIT68049.1 type III pantothenate kinase [Gemmatimonadota bacterium]NIU54075.1 type III pantothenate kinase [Gemmatimonadota bacterium]